jgi:hypothetical protein
LINGTLHRRVTFKCWTTTFKLFSNVHQQSSTNKKVLPFSCHDTTNQNPRFSYFKTVVTFYIQIESIFDVVDLMSIYYSEMAQLWNDFSSVAKSLCSTEKDADPILSKCWEKLAETTQQIAPLHSELVHTLTNKSKN